MFEDILFNQTCNEEALIESEEALHAEETEKNDAEDKLQTDVSPLLVSKLPYHERYYLHYGKGNYGNALDIKGTRAFLQGLGFDGGSLRQAREGKDRSGQYRSADQNKSNQMRCSFCGMEIAGVEFDRLPDGRFRCTSCSHTLVKTKEEAEELCSRVLANMEKFFSININVPISVEILEGRKLKKKLGIPLGMQDSQSSMILGAAVNNKKKFTIIMENGVPRISLIATFAHELTHIWQYVHWDNRKEFRKCSPSKRLLVYEGMAKWVEIQYLYLIGETNVAQREELVTKQRKDEYGQGFCLYEESYPLCRDAMICTDTPFTENSYPIG